MTSVLVGFSTIWVVIGLGWVLARTGILGDDAARTLADLSFFLGTPALLFLQLWRADLRQVFATHLVASCLAMAVAAAAYLLTERLVWHRGINDAVVATFGSYYVNAANIGIPISTYVLGDATWSAPILLIQVAVLQPLGLAVLDVRKARAAGAPLEGWRLLTLPLRNTLTIGALLGLAANLLHLRLPSLVVQPVELVGQLAVPTMLVAFGVTLFTGGFPGKQPHNAQVATIVAIKLFLMPAAAWLIATALGLDPHTRFAVTVLAGLPTAQNVFTNALRYRESVALARDIVFWATILSIPTLLCIAVLAHA